MRPLLALGCPDLAALRSPSNAGWAVRPAALAGPSLPTSDAVDTTLLVDVYRRHGLEAIGEVDVDGGAQVGGDDLGYQLLVALRGRLEDLPPSSRCGAGRVELDEVVV